MGHLRLMRRIVIAVVIVIGLSSIAATSAPLAKREEVHPVVWYTDGAFQPIGVLKQVDSRKEWSLILRRKWGEEFAIPLANQKNINSCEMVFRLVGRPLPSDASLGALQTYFDLRAIGCYAAKMIAEGSPAKASYLAGFRMDGNDARNLPAALTLVISNSQGSDIRQATKRGETLGDVVAKGATFQRIANPRGTAPMVRVNDSSGGIEDISLLACGDFNHDGIEDLLISVSSSVVGGTYTQNDLYLVTRLAPNAPMKVLKAYPDLGLGIPTFR